MESIWRATTELPEFKRPDGDIKTDILIIGGGITGILCAHMLSEAGADCVVLESGRIGSGVTSGTTAKITSQHGLVYHSIIRRFGRDAAQKYLIANQTAIERYRALSDSIDFGFEEKDSFLYSTNGTKELEKEHRALLDIGLDTSLTDKTVLPFPVSGALRMSRQAQCHPLKLISALSKKLRIYEHCAVREMQGLTAVTPKGKVKADAVIVATHFPFINKHGLFFMKMYQSRSYVLAADRAPDFGGMYLDASGKGLSLRSAEGLLLVGSGSHRTGSPGECWTPAEAFLRNYCPGAYIRYRFAAQDCMTLDGMPYIGQYSSHTPGLYVATGFNKWGMTSSMVSASILCDLVNGRKNEYAELFSPSRSMLRSQLFINIFESAKGLLTPSVKRCPHLGCALKWNPNEHSYDCPCHGSRFSESGSLLDGPATGGLKKRPPYRA